MSTGMPGFTENGPLGPDDGFDLAIGAVHGARWWSLTAPPDCWPHQADSAWRVSPLQGSYGGFWQPGRNTAECGQGKTHPIPDPDCGCGYWAYWDPEEHHVGSGVDICGIVKGTGRTLIGTRGFRSQHAEIVALHVSFNPRGRAFQRGGSVFWGSGTTQYVTGSRFGRSSDPRRIQMREEEERELREAWRAVIGGRLAAMYPKAVVYETMRLMLAMHPPETAYRPNADEVRTVHHGTAGNRRVYVDRRLLCGNLAVHPPGCSCEVPWVNPIPAANISLDGDGVRMIVDQGAVCGYPDQHPGNCRCLLAEPAGP